MEQQPKEFPTNWQIRDFNPQDHMMQLKNRDYLTVQARLLWFLRDQRALIVAGLATTSHAINTDLVEMDREHGWAHFRTYVRDVLGNEATMYGSESAKDFGDYAEKASTKSLGRALLALGYGTAFAPEMDEGERVVDAPVQRRGAQAQAGAPARVEGAGGAQTDGAPTATEKQMESIRKLCEVLGKPQPQGGLTYERARDLLVQLSNEYRRAQQNGNGGANLRQLPTGTSRP